MKAKLVRGAQSLLSEVARCLMRCLLLRSMYPGPGHFGCAHTHHRPSRLLAQCPQLSVPRWTARSHLQNGKGISSLPCRSSPLPSPAIEHHRHVRIQDLEDSD